MILNAYKSGELHGTQRVEEKKNLADALSKYNVEMWTKMSYCHNYRRWTKEIEVADVCKTGYGLARLWGVLHILISVTRNGLYPRLMTKRS